MGFVSTFMKKWDTTKLNYVAFTNLINELILKLMIILCHLSTNKFD